MKDVQIEIQGNEFLFGKSANHDLIQDALILEKMSKGNEYTEEEVDPLIWVASKLTLFAKNEEGLFSKWTYKGSRELLEVAIYSGINNHRRVAKLEWISLSEAKELLYGFSFEERGEITNAFVLSLIDKNAQNGQGELTAQQEAVG